MFLLIKDKFEDMTNNEKDRTIIPKEIEDEC